ncbi:hypothetical protein ACMV8I_07570 [Ewingella sp. S1.OA.A_B6]
MLYYRAKISLRVSHIVKMARFYQPPQKYALRKIGGITDIPLVSA